MADGLCELLTLYSKLQMHHRSYEWSHLYAILHLLSLAKGHERFADTCTCKNTAVDGWHQLRFICTYWSLSIRGEKVSQTCHSVITVRLLKAYVTDCHQTVLSCERKFTAIPYLSGQTCTTSQTGALFWKICHSSHMNTKNEPMWKQRVQE